MGIDSLISKEIQEKIKNIMQDCSEKNNDIKDKIKEMSKEYAEKCSDYVKDPENKKKIEESLLEIFKIVVSFILSKKIK